jgi:RHS repeat-associated protein
MPAENRSRQKNATKVASRIILGILVICLPGFSQINSGNVGDPLTLLPGGNGSLRDKTLVSNYFRIGAAAGMVKNNVDLISGLPSYSVKIGEIDQHDMVKLPITLDYNGGVEGTVKTENKKAPSGVAGLGWNLSTEIYVATDHRGTVSYKDDIFYCSGPFGSGQILVNASGNYFLANNPYLAISATKDANGRITEWKIREPNSGWEYFFGQTADSRRTQRTNGALVMTNRFSWSVGSDFTYRWDVDKIQDASGANTIGFTYYPFDETLNASSEVKYRRESQIKDIFTLDQGGNEVDRYSFQYQELTGEYVPGFIPREWKSSQRIFENHILDRIQCFHGGTLRQTYTFSFTNISSTDNRSGGKKLLKEIIIEYPYLGATINRGKWSFDYESVNNWALKSLTTPEGAKTDWEYGDGPTIRQVENPNDPPNRVRDMMYVDVNDGNTLKPVTLPLTSDHADAQLDSFCNDEFCFQVAVGRYSNPKRVTTYLEVWQNAGNHFAGEPVFRDAISSNVEWNYGDGAPPEPTRREVPEILPFDDGFLEVLPIAKKIKMFKWDGEQFVNQDLTGTGYFYVGSLSTVNLRTSLDVAFGNNFLVIADAFDRDCRIKAYTKTSSGNYHLSNVDLLLELPPLGSSDPTFVYERDLISAGGGMFGVVQQLFEDSPGHLKSILRLYALDNTGENFQEVQGIPFEYHKDHATSTNTDQLTDAPFFGKDYLIVNRSTAGQNAHPMYFAFDGSAIHQLDAGTQFFIDTGWNPFLANFQSGLEFFTSDDYFLIVEHGDQFPGGGGVDRSYGRVFACSKVNTNHDITCQEVANDVPIRSKTLIKANLSKSGFFLGYFDVTAGWNHGGVLGVRPFDRHFFQIGSDGNPIEITQLPGGLTVGGVSNLQFSPYSDMVITNSHVAGQNEDILQTFETNPGSATIGTFLETPKVVDYSSGVSTTWSEPGSLFSTSFVLSNGTVHFRLYHNNGFDYAPESQKKVVASVSHFSGVTGVPNLKQTFTYPSTAFDFVFNHHILSYQFANVEVANETAGKSVFKFYLDKFLEPFFGSEFLEHGKLKVAEEWSGNPTSGYSLISSKTYTRSFMQRQDWPGLLKVPTLTKKTEINRSDLGGLLGGERTTTTDYLRYDGISGFPHFTKIHLNAGTPDEKWMVSQYLPKGLGQNPNGTDHIPVRNIIYSFPDEASIGSLITAALDQPLSDTKAISDLRYEYSTNFEYLIDRAFGWRDEDQSLSRTELIGGTDPEFKLSENSFLKSEINRRNEFGQPTEISKVETQVPLNERRVYTTKVFEGRRSLPAAEFNNSRKENCDALLAENGDVFQIGGVDFDRAWQTDQVEFHSDKVHTGKFSFAAKTSYALVRDFFLRDVRQEKFGFVVSAWFYVPTGASPYFFLDRRASFGNLVPGGTAVGAPVGGAILYNQWQRWEAVIPYEDLIAGNLFNGDLANHVRVHLGMYSGTEVYIDDIVCRPSNSTFSLYTYNEDGAPTSSTDINYVTKYFEYDYMMRNTGSRDENFWFGKERSFHEFADIPTGEPKRNYEHSFKNGNLISNWSFENKGEGWFSPIPVDGFSYFNRIVAASENIKASTGRYIAMVDGNNSSATDNHLLVSDMIPVKPNTTYKLTYAIMAPNLTGTVFPAVNFSPTLGGNTVTHQIPGTPYSTSSYWSVYKMTFTTQASDAALRLYLFNTSSDINAGGKVYFDDVVLEEGNNPDAWGIEGENVTYFDALGRELQSQVRLSNGELPIYSISGRSFDVNGRADKEILPISEGLFGSSWIQDLETEANSYYSPASIGVPDADGKAFKQIRFASEPFSRIVQSSAQGAVWAIGNGHERKANYYFVDDLNHIPANIEAPVSAEVGSHYLLEWEKDEEGNYLLKWTNEEGLVVQTATNSLKASGTHSSWTWAKTRYQYSRGGELLNILTPIDVQNSTAAFGEKYGYNALGKITSDFSTDRGLERYWYNRSGNLRYSQDNQLSSKSGYKYADYDGLDRVVSEGVEIISNIADIQSFADERAHGQIDGISKNEHVGYIYNDLSSFTQRTLLSLNDLGLQGLMAENGNGRLVCSYRLNNEVPISSFGKKDKLVASFYDYNSHGFISKIFKYLGPVRTSGEAIHEAEFSYDALDRIVREDLYRIQGATKDLISSEHFVYDEAGRISAIEDGNGKIIALYSYEEWGPLKSVRIDFDPTINSGILIEYAHNIRGWLKSIKATQMTSGKILYEEYLGYDRKAYDSPSVPASTARFDGKIAQKIYRFANEIAEQGRVRGFNYTYDAMGRLIDGDYMENTNASPLIGTDLHVDWQNLVMALNTPDLDSHIGYDANDRITEKGNEGLVPAQYTYSAGSYRVDAVQGSISPSSMHQSMSGSGTFVYDEKGRLIHDRSKGLGLTYGWDDLPVLIEAQRQSDKLFEYQFYDAEGTRVSKIQVSKPVIASQRTLIIGRRESGEPDGLYDFESLDEAMAAMQVWIQQTPESELPASFVFINVPDRGTDFVEPTSGLEITTFDKGVMAYPLELDGILKDSQEYNALISQYFAGKPLSAVHYLNLLGGGTKEIREAYNPDWTLAQTHRIVGIESHAGQIGQIIDGARTEYFLKDHLGSTVRSISNQDANPFADGWIYDYLPYGEKKALQGGGNTLTPTYTGKEFEDENGLGFFGARLYDPEIGGWTSTDPAAEYANPYSFVGGDPINKFDPDGMDDIVDPAGVYITGGGTGQASTGGQGAPAMAMAPGQASARTTSLFRFEVEKAPPSDALTAPSPNGLDGVDVLKLALKKVQTAADPSAQLEKAEAGGFRGKNGKINKAEVLKASAVLLILNVGTEAKGVPLLAAPTRVANAGGVIRSFVQSQPQVYYRVFSGNQTGSFLTAVRPTSSVFAREALALPPSNTAAFVQEVLVPGGTRLQRSRALGAFGRRGGAEQFELLDQIPFENFGPGVPLQ